MDKQRLAEAPYRLDVADAFLRTLCRHLRANDVFDEEQWDRFLGAFEDNCPADDPKHVFFCEEVLAWFDGGKADISASLREILDRSELRKKLFGEGS
jgi:hypothetical protein